MRKLGFYLNFAFGEGWFGGRGTSISGHWTISVTCLATQVQLGPRLGRCTQRQSKLEKEKLWSTVQDVNINPATKDMLVALFRSYKIPWSRRINQMSFVAGEKQTVEQRRSEVWQVASLPHTTLASPARWRAFQEIYFKSKLKRCHAHTSMQCIGLINISHV